MLLFFATEIASFNYAIKGCTIVVAMIKLMIFLFLPLLIQDGLKHNHLFTFSKYELVMYGERKMIPEKVKWYQLNKNGKPFGFKMVHTRTMDELFLRVKYGKTVGKKLFFTCFDNQEEYTLMF